MTIKLKSLLDSFIWKLSAFYEDEGLFITILFGHIIVIVLAGLAFFDSLLIYAIIKAFN